MSFANIETLDQYLNQYGPMLGRKAIEALDPLYVPGETPPLDLSALKRTPFPSQANVINGAALAWKDTRSIIICGEMGTGKTLLGAAAIHAAIQARTPGKPYRALIMAPNHLIDKWRREIECTIPDAEVRTFEKSDANKGDDSYKGFLRYAESCRSTSRLGRWRKPERPEWLIVGRNQAKWDAGWQSMGEREWDHNPGSTRSFMVAKEDAFDEATGRPLYDSKGRRKQKVVTDTGVACPKCGMPARDSSGLLLSAEAVATSKKPLTCEALYLQEVAPEKKPGAEDVSRKPTGYDMLRPVPKRYAEYVTHEGRRVTINERVYEVRQCGEPLWQWIPSPRKWAPARIIHKKAKGLFDYFVLDEMHEEKEADSAQGIAAGKLMAASRRVIGLTGTLIGGYANHLFSMLFRMAPRSLVEEGFQWKGEMKFAKCYGRVDKIVTTKFGEEPVRSSKRRGSTSMRKGDGRPTVREEVKPGVMPTFFGRHLIDKALFISLDEMYDDLPDLSDDDRSLIPVAMDPDLADEYARVQSTLVAVNNELMRKGCMKLMSTLLHTLLSYPDKPYGWEPPPGCEGSHSVGYWLDAQNKLPRNYVGVVSPANLDDERIYAKEEALLDLIAREAAEGRQCWVYCEMTGKRDIQARLAKLIKAAGYSCKVLRSSTVDTREREAWINEHGPTVHVMISNPDLVSTGLDFFDKEGTFNFSTIIFYQPSYDINATRQAGHRHWRIGQPLECRTYYLYYQGTMQHRAVKHCGDKLSAAKSLEGKFSAEGLAALASGGLAMTELARTLSSKIEDPRAAWSKLRGATKARVAKLAKEHTLTTLAAVVHEHQAHVEEARALADHLVNSNLDLGLIDDLPPESIEVSDADLAEFGRAMAELGISLDDLAD